MHALVSPHIGIVFERLFTFRIFQTPHFYRKDRDTKTLAPTYHHIRRQSPEHDGLNVHGHENPQYRTHVLTCKLEKKNRGSDENLRTSHFPHSFNMSRPSHSSYLSPMSRATAFLLFVLHVTTLVAETI